MMLMNCRRAYKIALASVLIIFANILTAGDLKVNASIDTEWIEQAINIVDDDTNIDSSNQIIKPFAIISYVGRDIRASIQGTHNHVRRQLDSEHLTQNYPTVAYSADYDAIKGLLNVSVKGSQNYRSEGISSFLVDDFLLNGDSLNKISSQQASASLTLPKGKYFGLVASTFYSKNNSDTNNNDTSSAGSLFNSQSHGVSLSASSGKRIKGIRSSITGSLNYVKRGNNQDFVSQNVNFNNDIKVYSQFGLAFNTSYENNELKAQSDDSFDSFREFYSIGAGIVWQSSIERSLEIAWNRSYNKPQGDIGDTEENDFISYDVNWAFSDRTKIQGTFTRRFFGDAGDLSISHRLRNWRSSLTYRESVNTTSQLANGTDVALFICEGGSTSIADCSLSDTLNPELGAGQTLQPIVVQNFGLNDRVILNKNLTAQTAVTRRRTTLSLTGTKSEIEELEFDRVFDTASVNLELAFKLSARTNLTLSSKYASIETVDIGELEGQTTREQSIELTRKLTRRLSTSIGLRHLDRVGELNRGNAGFGGLNGSLTDKRITLKVSYQFGNKQ
ncbi:MAG: hypothetical protein ACJA0G_000807 [Kangiellaceae bacterium]|jgi:uncharacterized protein (PEP-CTERM system associated)